MTAGRSGRPSARGGRTGARRVRREGGTTLVELMLYLALFTTVSGSIVAMEVFARRTFTYESAFLQTTVRASVLDDLRWDLQRALEYRIEDGGETLVLILAVPEAEQVAGGPLVEHVTYHRVSDEAGAPKALPEIHRVATAPDGAPIGRTVYGPGYTALRFTKEPGEGHAIRIDLTVGSVSNDQVIVERAYSTVAAPRAYWGRDRRER